METVKRGYEPKDKIEFGPKAAAKLNAAAQELAFLLDRGYDKRTCVGVKDTKSGFGGIRNVI